MRYSIFIFFIIFAILIIHLNAQFFTKPIFDKNKEFYIHTGTTFNELIVDLDSLSSSLSSVSKQFYTFFLKKKRLDYWFKPGRYILEKSFSFNDVVNKLRSQSEDPVKLVFNSMDNVEPVLGIAGSYLELDSLDLINYLDSINFPVDSLSFFLIPNTYELFWSISSEDFFNRIYWEYDKFWNDKNLRAAESIHLSKHEVFILASIVDKEASHFNEMPRIAGLYLNRLKKGWPLASDPTIIYIWKNKFNQSIRRVRNKHIDLTKTSLFNTYHNKGLPPKPICVPSLQAIESVLFAEEHQYMYMCARPDGSEYHNFAVNYREHQKNAKSFHNWLNKRKIY